jgi:hypothetical protein
LELTRDCDYSAHPAAQHAALAATAEHQITRLVHQRLRDGYLERVGTTVVSEKEGLARD